MKYKSGFYIQNLLIKDIKVMFTHQEIWDAIDRLAMNKDLSTSALAKKAGLDATTFNKSKRITASGKLRWPSTESISKILFVTGVSFHEFVDLTENEKLQPTYNKDSLPYFRDIKSIEEFILSGGGDTKQNYNLLPEKSQKTVCFEITNSSLEPDYKKGQLLILDFDTDYSKDDIILVCNHDKKLFTHKIIQETVETFYTTTLENKNQNEISKKDCLWHAKILWYSQSR